MKGASSEGRFVIDLPDSDAALALAGVGNQTLHSIEALTGASLVIRGLELVVAGLPTQLEKAVGVLELIRPLWQEGQIISSVDLQAAFKAFDKGYKEDHASLSDHILVRSKRGIHLRPKTIRQKAYIKAMETHDLTFGIGPAGTGKTFLAAVLAVRMLMERKVERLVLTRPAVEAGERLGFLPGDLQQKVDPYLRPLYDSFHTLLGMEKTNALLEKGVIEVAPLAYMRGRTLENSFVILDEAQNTTSAQMKMFLTRLGERSRMVVTGDITQIDLPGGVLSGLVEACDVLEKTDGIAISRLTAEDVVRHSIVQKVVDAYARKDS
ncbi:PhoH family protein [Prochlorococcus sp. MIT 1341]|uniref:PhoH family protein n=1 Tax=Prochlorococcus sp. MIT 1341 TaxID=3096221 RepID=UPI002A75CE0B|nr:PhoH family protein [Prochlorococcus sp. MIT 1341]